MNRLKQKQLPDPATDGNRAALRSIDGLGDDARTPAVEVSQLRKIYPGGVEAVKGISFEVAPGERYRIYLQPGVI
jgi:hypothetical protein